MLRVNGIPNCDSVRRARRWLDTRGTEYAFRDFKKDGPDNAELARWAGAAGWERLLNRRGTTWRKLPAAERDGIDRDAALRLMEAHPTLIKRPVLEVGDTVLIGFDEGEWAAALG